MVGRILGAIFIGRAFITTFIRAAYIHGILVSRINLNNIVDEGF